MTTISMNLYGILNKIKVSDGYRVRVFGEDYIDDLDSLWMLLNDYNGYKIIEMSMSTGIKDMLVFFLEK